MQKKSLIFIMVFALAAAWLQPINIVKATGRADGANQIIASSRSSFVIRPDGSLWGWGLNNRGQLGDGTSTDKHVPVHIMDDVIAIDSSQSSTKAITSDNTLWIWGFHAYEQPLEEGIIDQFVPTRLLDDVVAVASSNFTIMAIRTDGSLWSAGSNAGGMLGTYGDSRTHFEKVMDDVAAVTVGAMHVLVIKTDGSLWAWGSNSFGQLGDGTTTDRSEPVHIMDDVSVISANTNNSAAVTTDNVLWVWGNDTMYALPSVDIEAIEPVPLEIHAGYITSVLLGGDVIYAFYDRPGYIFHRSFIMFTLEDGSLLSWGSNKYGQLGNGSGVSFDSLEKIKDDVISVAGSERTVLAITDDGNLWAWGYNENGAVGDNSTINRPMPVSIMDANISTDAPQVPDLESIDEENGYTYDLYQDDLEEDDLHEYPEHEYNENDNDYEEPSEGINQTVLMVAGVVVIVILSIAILILAYSLIKQRR